MHDNLILPMEPVGVLGAKPNVDLGNVPVMTSPLDFRWMYPCTDTIGPCIQRDVPTLLERASRTGSTP